MDQGWGPESLLEEHNNRLVVDRQDDVSLVVESVDMNSSRDSPFFWMMLARSQSTLGCAHVA
jgi:hypothetical protein